MALLPAFRYISSYCTVSHSRSTKMLSEERPFRCKLISTQHLGELAAGDLTFQARIDHIRPAVAQRFRQCRGENWLLAPPDRRAAECL